MIPTILEMPPENSKASSHSIQQLNNAAEIGKNQTVHVICVNPKTSNLKNIGPDLAQRNSISLLWTFFNECNPDKGNNSEILSEL